MSAPCRCLSCGSTSLCCTAPEITAAPDLLAALQGLFEHCAMIHKHWGDGSNAKQADAALDFARAAIAKAEGRL